MKQTILKNILQISLGAVFAISLSYVALAAPASSPSGAPFTNNIESFVNVGTTDQVKNSGLGVTTFVAEQDAVFASVVYFGKSLLGVGGPIAFGGSNADGISTPGNPKTALVSLAISGDLEGATSLQSKPLVNSTNTALCADAGGFIVLCGSSTNSPVTPPVAPSNPAPILGSLSGKSSFAATCSNTVSGTSRSYIYQYSNVGPLTGTIVYDSATTPLNGSGLWWKLFFPSPINQLYGVQIDTDGKILASNQCP